MAHILKNKNIEIHIDLPNENYNFSRFDWTGKISNVKFQNILLSTTEKSENIHENIYGKGFYNEFGIDNALGFEEAKIGEWFHKIGIGILKKTTDHYFFHEKHEVKSLNFVVEKEFDTIFFKCSSPIINGFSYKLKKRISLIESGFKIEYNLLNNGEKDIITDEYVHNFISLGKEMMNENYRLKFPFQLKPENFEEIVNPENKIILNKNSISFKATPKEQFFMSNLTGNKKLNGNWELINTNTKIGISETANFKTSKMNLWGWKHVISPEIFFDIKLTPGKSIKWSRTYNVFNIK